MTLTRYNPPQYYVVRRHESFGSRTVYGAGGLERFVLADKTVESVIAEFVPSWRWRPGDYKTSLKGWRTPAAARRKAASFGPAARVFELMIDDNGPGGTDFDVLVECAFPDTGAP